MATADGPAKAVILLLAILILELLAGGNVNIEWGIADSLADCYLISLQFCIAVSCRSSAVWNWAQVRSQNYRINGQTL